MSEQQNQFKQGIGNYKGLMICTRPNEKIEHKENHPFISRVDKKELLGTNPVAKIQFNQPIKRVHIVLSRHKQWLEQYKKYVKHKQQTNKENNENKIKKTNKVNKIIIIQFKISKQLRQQSVRRIAQRKSNIQNENTDLNQQNSVENEENLYISNQQLQNILRVNNSNKKPQWSKSEQQIQKEEDQECQDLLDFANNLDYESYINDLEVQSVVKALKDRISNIKVEQSQKENQSQSQQQDETQKIQQSQKSVKIKNQQKTELKTEQNKQELKEDWNSETNVEGTKFKSNLMDKIVKHLAEKILKNNKYLKGIYSQNSIKQLLVGEVKKYFQ
ncbi:hypothetical protein IMG5_092720, partial [Ichthyophthirius multifiliis]